MNNHSFTVSEAINTGWKFTKKYFWILMLLGGIAYIPSLVSNLFNAALPYIPGATISSIDPLTNLPSAQPQGVRAIIVVIVSVIAGILGARLGLGLTKTNLMILEDKKPVVKDLCVPFIYVLRLIGWWILVGLAVIIGFIALIIPGIYIATRLSLFQYFIAQGYGTIDSIKASRSATQGNIWKLIWIGFVYIGVTLLWILALVIWLLWAIPTVMLAQTYVYTQLKKNIPDTFKPIN